MLRVWQFDFRPAYRKEKFPDSIAFPYDGSYVEGNAAVAEQMDGTFAVGIYVWSGPVALATKVTLESIVGSPSFMGMEGTKFSKSNIVLGSKRNTNHACFYN